MTPPQLASSLSHSAVTPAVDVKGSLPPNTPASHGHKPRQPSCRLPRRPLAVLDRDILPIIAHASLRCHRTRRPCHRPRRASPFAGHDRTFSGRPATPLCCRRRELRRPLPIWLRGVWGGAEGGGRSASEVAGSITPTTLTTGPHTRHAPLHLVSRRSFIGVVSPTTTFPAGPLVSSGGLLRRRGGKEG